jgi:hypothetical protein
VADGVLASTWFDPTADRSVCVAIVETIELVTDRTKDLPPLGERIDTDAVDALFSTHFGTAPEPAVRLSFPYEEWQVTVSGTGEIVVGLRPGREIARD